MALTRKFLQAMGIEAEKIDEIIDAHRDTVDALKDERDKYKVDAEKLPGVQKDLNDATAKLEEYSDADGRDKWKVKYDALKEEYDGYKSGIDKEKSKAKKKAAYKKLLQESGVAEKRLEAVLRVTDLDALELDDTGKLKDTDKLTTDIKAEWSDFISVRKEEGADKKTPPEGEGGGNNPGKSRAAEIAAKHYEMLYGKEGE